MSPDEFRAAIAFMHWSARDLAEIVHYDDRTLRRVYAGKLSVPQALADWLTQVVTLVAEYPTEDWHLWGRRPDPADNEAAP